MSMSKVNKGGRPREEPTNVRSIRVPDRVWKLVNKASKGYRSINEYQLSLNKCLDKLGEFIFHSYS